MTNREWLAKYMHVSNVGDVFKYALEQGICLSPWHDGNPIDCPLIDIKHDKSADCIDCFNAWLNQNYYEGTE